MKEIIKKLSELKDYELDFVILELLKRKKIDYVKLSSIYVDYLKYLDNENRMIIHGLALPLSAYWQGEVKTKVPKGYDKKFVKEKSAYNLLKSKVFHTAGIEKDLKKVVEERGYYEDEDGMPHFKK